jgi:HEPN domain-containing protein
MGIRESRYPEDWLAKAKKDLRRVEILLAADDTEGAGFNLQQMVEKLIKAYLLEKGWRLERTHDLVKLLNSAIHYYRANFEKYRHLCQQATEYYFEERYPIFNATSPTKDEISWGLSIARELLADVETVLAD